MELDTWLHIIEVLILSAGAFFAVRQLRLQREEIHTNALREHRRHSMEIDSRLAELSDERQKVESAFPPSTWTGRPIQLQDLRAAFVLDEQLEPALLRWIEQMELLALPVCAGAADEDMAFELVGSTIVNYAITFGEYIRDRRASHRRPDLYVYLTTLVDQRWAARDKLEATLISSGGLPFFMRQLSQSSPAETSTLVADGREAGGNSAPNPGRADTARLRGPAG